MKEVSKATLLRLPVYLKYLKNLSAEQTENNNARTISATSLAAALHLGDVQVRKDLAAVSNSGKPKVGYLVRDLIEDLENFLGYKDVHDAVLVGAGKLGRALLGYRGFADYGLNIVAAFDESVKTMQADESGKQVLSMEKFANLCDRMKISIGIITVPAEHAQEVCDRMVASGIMAIWNFAPVMLHAPEDILIQNENMAASLAVLSSHLSNKNNNESEGK